MGNKGSKIKIKKINVTKKLMLELEASTHFTVDEIKVLHGRFKELSKIGKRKGGIDILDFQNALGLSNMEFAERIFAAFDSDGNSTIDFIEFVNGLSAICSRANISEKARFCFNVFDISKDGLIERDELMIVLSLSLKENSSVSLSEDKLSSLVDKTYQQIDTDGNGVIDFQEFENAAIKNPAILNCVNVDIQYLFC